MEELVQQLLNIIKEKDAEIQRLSNLIFNRAGYLVEGDATASPETSSPTKIRTGRMAWSDVQGKLEKLHSLKKPDWKAEAEKASRELKLEEIEILDLKDIQSA